MRDVYRLLSVVGFATFIGCTGSTANSASTTSTQPGMGGGSSSTKDTEQGIGGKNKATSARRSTEGGTSTKSNASSTPEDTGGSGGESTGSGSELGGANSKTSRAAGSASSKSDAGTLGGSSAISTSSSSKGGDATAGGSGSGMASSSGGALGSSASTSKAVVVTKFIGNISSKNKDIQSDFASQWQQVTMEANSKWGFVQPDSADQWVWEPVDKVYKYAMDNHLVFKEHAFFWNFEQPSWVTASNVGTAGPAWIKAFCERYPKTAMIDVVNEPAPGHNPAPYRAGMGGEGASGFDWVVQAFKWAREYCPNAILILNDFNVIEYERDRDQFATMLEKVLEAGAPVDAIGAQGHDAYKVEPAQVKANLDYLFDRFKLPIYITELDIDEADDTKQQTAMENLIPMFWDHPAVHGITHWGYVKGEMWRTNAWLEDTSGKPRPAMTWLQDFIAAHR